jgi:integral membrane protein (TIGR01906 family)
MKYLSRLLTILFPLILILGIIISLSTSQGFYEKEISKPEVISRDYVTEEEGKLITKNTLEYLKGKTEINSTIVGEKAAIHMVDVKNLINLSKYLLITLIIFFLICLLILKKNKQRDLIPKILVNGSIITILFNILLFILSKVSFTKFWRVFHQIMFTNDAWQLNPYKEPLVAVFSQRFFLDFINFVIYSSIIMAVIFIIIGISWQYAFSQSKNIEKKSEGNKQIKAKKSEDFQW